MSARFSKRSVSLTFIATAALKCRQRKKQWLTQLQAKVEFLSNENERLSAALVASRDEISRLNALVGAGAVGLHPHANGMGAAMPVSVGAPMGMMHPGHHMQQHHRAPSSSSGSAVSFQAPPPPSATLSSNSVNGHHHHGSHGSPHAQGNRSPATASEGRSSRSSANGSGSFEGSPHHHHVQYGSQQQQQQVVVGGRGYGY